MQKDYSEHGDLGLAAFHARSNQRTMFPMPPLTLETVFSFAPPYPIHLLSDRCRAWHALRHILQTWRGALMLADSAEHKTCHCSSVQEHMCMHICAVKEEAVLSRGRLLCMHAFLRS